MDRLISQLAMTVALLLLYGCMNEPDLDRYQGAYQYPSFWDGSPQVVNIFREGEQLLLREIGNKGVVPLEQSDGGVRLNGVLIYLSADGKTLYLPGREAFRVSAEQAAAYQKALLEDRELCLQLEREVEQRVVQEMPARQWNEYITQLNRRKPDGCLLPFYGAR